MARRPVRHTGSCARCPPAAPPARLARPRPGGLCCRTMLSLVERSSSPSTLTISIPAPRSAVVWFSPGVIVPCTLVAPRSLTLVSAAQGPLSVGLSRCRPVRLLHRGLGRPPLGDEVGDAGPDQPEAQDQGRDDDDLIGVGIRSEEH